jgi:tetratricopeptide (TPR) repeat protein
MLCYRYAVLANNAGLPADQIRPALERAVALDPRFDDAHYLLALLEKNAGRNEPALAHLRAMQTVAPARAYAYWSATADALLQLDRRAEAKEAARKAAVHATAPAERAHAGLLAQIADTDLAVQVATDAEGRVQLLTTRAPHDTANWNPFIEPGDDIRRVQGALRRIECGDSGTRLVIETSTGPLTLAIADPTRVQMRNSPPEFTCGPQESPAAVAVEYAAPKSPGADALVRGVTFR